MTLTTTHHQNNDQGEDEIIDLSHLMVNLLTYISCTRSDLIFSISCFLVLGALGCTTIPEDLGARVDINSIEVTILPVNTGIILPGGYFEVQGSGFLEGATYEAQLSILGARYLLPTTLLDSGHLDVQVPVDVALSLNQGSHVGELLITVILEQAVGAASTSWTGTLFHHLTPTLNTPHPSTAPSSEALISGTGFLKRGEGQSLLELNGMLTTDRERRPIQTTVYLDAVSFDRSSAVWVATPDIWHILPGLFTGQVRVINQAQSGLNEGQWVEVSFDYQRPKILSTSPISISRGQFIYLLGRGFLGGNLERFTTVNFQGTFTPYLTSAPAQSWSDLSLDVEWRSGRELSMYLNARFDQQCESQDLGGRSGVLSGVMIPTITLQDEVTVGEETSIELEILPNKQVVYLRFLPAFTDSLRLFGLRNVSARVIEEILSIVRQDYEGVNVDFRLTAPEDFAHYSIIEIGGADPNAQSLFGLDNTTGLDVCNQRLDDYLAGRNADSGGTFGGVFVESFLNLSPSRGDNPIADPLFDDIFDPVINDPAKVIESAERVEVVDRAIRVLGHLVGNTLTHELGHSLGLPVIPGCGQYHNIPGELQIMDCGQDRPFLERAGLDPRGKATWTPENYQYLKKILPIY